MGVLFPALDQEIHHLPVHQEEAHPLRRKIPVHQLLEQEIEQVREQPGEQRVALPVIAHRQHHLIPRLPPRHHLGQFFRRVLQVGRDKSCAIPPRLRQPRQDRRVRAEVARQLDHPHPPILLRQLAQYLEGIIP